MKKEIRFDKKYIKKIIKQLKRYGFAHIPDNDILIEGVKIKFPNVEIVHGKTLAKLSIEGEDEDE